MLTTNRIKTLHVTEASNAGVGGHVLDLVEGLPKVGCDVHLVYSPRRTDEFFQNRLKQIPNVELTTISMRRGPHWSDLRAARELHQVIRDHGPFDIIHAHSTKAGGLCRTGKIAKEAKIVYTPNGIFSMNPLSNPLASRIVRVAEKRLARKGDRIIAVSPEEEQHMLEIGLPSEKIRMVPNGLRAIEWQDRQTVRNQLNLCQKSLVFGFLGRLAPQKNPLLLIRAFARVRFEPGQVRLAIVGTGPLEDEAKSLADELGISSHIDWLGYKTAPESMPAFDVFVMPSRYEGMPYVMMEATSLGLPVVATKVGGTSLGIDDGKNGFVVPLEDEVALADALQKLIDDENLRSDLSEGALVKAASFSVDLMVQRTLQIYDECLERTLVAATK